MYFSAFTWIYLESLFSSCITEEVCADLFGYLTKHSDVTSLTTTFIFNFKFKLLRLQHI
uniref:Uncharacterized protein n=2 Tax=Cercopithecinae TaxID=9528 RepID=A0A8D2EDI7_THEGE|nr:unnamed protein product [Macaca fascicularis]